MVNATLCCWQHSLPLPPGEVDLLNERSEFRKSGEWRRAQTQAMCRCPLIQPFPGGRRLFSLRLRGQDDFCVFPECFIRGMGIRVAGYPCINLARAHTAQPVPVRTFLDCGWFAIRRALRSKHLLVVPNAPFSSLSSRRGSGRMM